MFTLAAGYAQAEKLCASGGKKEATFTMIPKIATKVSIKAASKDPSVHCQYQHPCSGRFLLYWNTRCETNEEVGELQWYSSFYKDFYCAQGGKVGVRATSGRIEVDFTTQSAY